jgi:hypothetical protein
MEGDRLKPHFEVHTINDPASSNLFKAHLIEFNTTKRRNIMNQKNVLLDNGREYVKALTGGSTTPIPGKFCDARHIMMRWLVLLTLQPVGESGAYEQLVLALIQSAYPDATVPELRRQLTYLAKRQLINIHKEKGDLWIAYLTCYGAEKIEAAKAEGDGELL